MLVRNFKTVDELNRQKQLQKQLLDIAIENERINQDRISNYQNPNKPPPVPPQYKSQLEIQQDVSRMEKDAVSNLESLGIDLPTAINVVNGIRTSNIDNLVKFNRNFPFIKKDITEKFNVKLLNVATISAYLDSIFNDIDENFGLASKSNVELLAQKGAEFSNIFPTKNIVDVTYEMISTIPDFIRGFKFGEQDYSNLIGLIENLAEVSPTDNDLKAIDELPVNERNKVLRKLSSIIKRYRIPSSLELFKILENLRVIVTEIRREEDDNVSLGFPPDDNVNYEEFRRYFSLLKKNLGSINDEGLRAIKEVRDTITELLEVKDFQGELVSEIEAKNKLAEEALDTTLDKDLTTINEAESEKYGVPIFPFGNGKEVYQTLKGEPNVDYVEKIVSGPNYTYRKFMDRFNNPKLSTIYSDYVNDVPRDERNQPIVEVLNTTDGKQKSLRVGEEFRGYRLPEKNSWGFIYEYPSYLKYASATIDRNGKLSNIILHNRYNAKGVKDLIRQEEYPSINAKSKSNPFYDLENNLKDRVIPSQGFGIKKKKGDFNPSRIKIGKGISVEEEPRYKTFGKYVIHNNQLLNDGILNVKYPSLGPVPSIKPAKISESYKDFVIDVIENGRPNERLFKNLTQNEKEHFEKISRGAGLLGKFKNSVNIEVDDKKDVERFNVLKGEFDAGNNNEKMVKELRTLTVKFINNNKIKRGEGMDLLLELSKI
jgi:hypothetical protein